MLKLDADSLVLEVNAARTFRRKHLLRVQDIEARLVGNWVSTDWETDPQPENAVFSFMAAMLPELAHTHPTCRIRPARVWTHKDIADFLQLGVEAWFRESGSFVEELRDCVRDMVIAWGVGMVGMEDRDHGDRRPRLDAQHAMRPFFQHIARHRYLIDPRCKKQGDSRWEGHEYDVDASDLPLYEHFDQAAINQLLGMAGDPTDGDRRETGHKPPAVGDREQVRLVDMWIRDTNQICTLAETGGDGATSILVRPPTDYQGAPNGPYVLFGLYSVPNDPYPMSALQAAMETIEETNAHARAASNEASEFKNITLVDAAASDVLAVVADGKSGVHPIKGLNGKNVVQLAIGQIHPERMEHIAALRERTDRNLGIGDNQRGRITNATATETQEVAGKYDVRVSYMRGRVEGGTHAALRKVIDRLFYSPLVVMPVQKIDPATGLADEGTYYGGPQPGQEGVDWIDFYLEIVPQSMSLADDQVLQQLWVQAMELATQAAQGMATMPFINWKFMFDQWGETWNQKRLSDVVFNPMALAAFAQNPRAFGMGQPVAVPGDVNPAIPAQGLGVPVLPTSASGQRPPQGQGPPGAAGGIASAAGGGAFGRGAPKAGASV